MRKAQKELDKYYFFFAIWCWDETKVRKKCRERDEQSAFIFPITTEDQFIFLKNKVFDGIGIRTSVGALQGALDSYFSDRWDYVYIFRENLTPNEKNIEREENISIGNTESLIERLNEKGKYVVNKYLKDICDCSSGHLVPHHYYDDNVSVGSKLVKGVKFSDRSLMFRLLRNEHKLIISLDHHFYVIQPQYYKQLKQFLTRKEYRLHDAQADARRYPNPIGGLSGAVLRLNRYNMTFTSVTKSLFIPKWRSTKVIKHITHPNEFHRILRDSV